MNQSIRDEQDNTIDDQSARSGALIIEEENKILDSDETQCKDSES